MPPILVQATLFMAQAIILEASLSFLGLGQQPPAASWGSMLNTAKNFMEQAPWMSIFPGIAICLVVIDLISWAMACATHSTPRKMSSKEK